MKNVIKNRVYSRMVLSLLGLMIPAILIIVPSSCKKFLDVKPISEFGFNAVFSDVSNATTTVMGAYAPLSGNGTYGKVISLYFPYDTDEGFVTGQDDQGRRGIGHYDLRPGNTELATPWSDLYKGIERANICIEQIPLMPQYNGGSASDQKELKRLHGEVLTIRAQCYFELIRNWGDVPAPMIPSYKQTDLNLPKMDRDVLYDLLIEDLRIASDLVPWRSEVSARDERITKGAVKGLRAKLALYRAGYSLRNGVMQAGSGDRTAYYQIAKDECKAIIDAGQHGLNTSFSDLWKKYVCGLTLDPTGEILFEIAHAGGNSDDDSQLGNYIGIKSDVNSRYGNGLAGINVVATYFYAFDSVDTRRDITIGPYTIGGTNIKSATNIKTMAMGKFRREWRPVLVPGSAQFLGYNWPLIRYSDILLMFAEADNELNNGPSPEAVLAFEAVRKRAYLGNEGMIGLTPTDKAGFFDALMKERLLEFGGEGIRKYDLIRWNLLGTKIAETKTDQGTLRDGLGKYTNVPMHMFYKNIGEEFVWTTSFSQPSDSTFIKTPPAGWKKVDWRQSIQNSLDGSNSYITAIAKYYTPGTGKELFPIQQSVLVASPGLQQNFGY